MRETSCHRGNPDLQYGGNGLITAHEFQKKIRAVGWTQTKIEKALGYKKSWLSKIIHGARKMNCDDLLKICALTGISPHELLGFSQAEPRPLTADERISRELAEFLPDNIYDGLVRFREERKKK